MHPTTDANVPATATNETPLEPAKRTKTASVARVAVIDEMVDGLPAQQYSPGNRAVMRKIVRRLMVLENFGE